MKRTWPSSAKKFFASVSVSVNFLFPICNIKRNPTDFSFIQLKSTWAERLLDLRIIYLYVGGSALIDIH